MAIKKKTAVPEYVVLSPGIQATRVTIASAQECKVLRVKTSLGHELDIELWERCPGELMVRGVSGSLVVRPHSSNVVLIQVDR